MEFLLLAGVMQLHESNDTKFLLKIIFLIGPAGLSTALVLQSNGLRNITIIEKRSDSVFESEKAYQYYLDGRGQRLTNLLNLTQAIAAAALSNFEKKDFIEFFPSGVRRFLKVPRLRSTTEKFFLPRSTFLRTFLNEIQHANERNPENPIHIMFNTSCKAISHDEEGKLSVSTITWENGLSSKLNENLFKPSLLVGCDGLNSTVRTWLKSNVDEKFSLQSYPSESAGLRFKMLALKPSFLLYTDQSRTTKAPTMPNVAFSIRSIFQDSFRRISLILFAVKGGRCDFKNNLCY